MTYLGIQLTSPSTLLLRTNISLLSQKLQDIAKSLLSTNASWAGWIALSKMFLLPYVLYLFRTLPVPILHTDIAFLQWIFNNFIWAVRKPRIKASLLNTPTKYDGLGVPNLRLYYKAIILDQTKKWWDMSSLQPWTLIETTNLAHTPSHLLAAIWMGHHPPHSFLPTVNATIATWKSILQISNGIHIQALYQLPLVAISLLSPDLPLQRWSSQGLHRIGDMFQHSQLLSFCQLSDQYSIPNKDFYMYLRIRHILASIPTFQNTWTKDLIQFFNPKNNKTRGISYLYHLSMEFLFAMAQLTLEKFYHHWQPWLYDYRALPCPWLNNQYYPSQ